jgi:hypothetical protein
MTQTVNRMYGNLENAQHAVALLTKAQFEDVFLIAPSDDGEGIVERITGAYVWKGDAEVLAEGVWRGGCLVVVHAPFGTAGRAIRIMNGCEPIDSGLPDATTPPTPWDDATPLSCALHLPVLLSDDQTFAAFAGLPPLADPDWSVSAAIGLPMLSDQAAPLSSKIGLPALSQNAAPLSSLLKLPLLWDGR